ncbi:hypothetical protein DRE_00871 [Drechslerella stenobrocha 248]|uniref:Coenzyme Q-binding protein COQ10 START domain-containing protein n=1 Tax=Drechslerella stenobrocha 248 TaxID=1043628 RepID=W7HZ62_9PEZI|nr:hypothetical protein DRE_00871 [Drechslerella stenobrocha 248]
MSAAKDSEPRKRQRIQQPGRPTPSFSDGGYFTVSSAPVKIAGSKQQIIQTLLRFEAYHTWNNFVPQVTDIEGLDRAADGGSNGGVRVGTKFTMHARLFASLPCLTKETAEEVTVINEDAGKVAWGPVTKTAERVHLVTEADYGTCNYESYITFQKTPTNVAVRWLLPLALQMRFDEWAADLKAAVEAQNW